MFFKGIAQGYIPAELIDYSQLSVELSSPFSVSEINLMNQKGDLNGSMKIDFDKYDYYNKVGYREVNQELIDGFTKVNKSNRFVYKRDIEEKKDSSRFLVRSHFNLSSGDKLYFIYDTQTNISYENFYSVKQLIKALEHAYHL